MEKVYYKSELIQRFADSLAKETEAVFRLLHAEEEVKNVSDILAFSKAQEYLWNIGCGKLEVAREIGLIETDEQFSHVMNVGLTYVMLHWREYDLEAFRRDYVPVVKNEIARILNETTKQEGDKQ